MKDKNNITPHKAYLLSLGKKYAKECTAEELKKYKSLLHAWSYEKNKEKRKAKMKAHYEKNKEERKAKMKAYYERTKEERDAKRKAYYEKDREKWANYQREWIKNNREYVNARAKEKRANFSLEQKIKEWLYYAKWRCGDGRADFVEVVGMSIDEFIKYIESQFVEGMSWDNWGVGKGREVWHIDHIKPVVDGGGNHYTNLQPLWCVDNHRKKFN